MNPSQTRRALFLFPTDQMGGAERVTRQLVQAAVESGKYDVIECCVIAKRSQGTLADLASIPNVSVFYTNAPRELMGLIPFIKAIWGKEYDFVFSSHAHINALMSLLRRVGVLTVRRLVARESTLIFERDLGWKGNLVKLLYKFYGSHDLIICQTERMAISLNKNTRGRLASKTIVLNNPVDLRKFSVVKERPDLVPGLICFRGLKLVWCGRFSSVKDPFLAIDVLRSIIDAGVSDVRLVMIGEGGLREAIEAYAAKKSISDEVILTGYHSFPAEIFKFCDVGLLTSEIEGFPNVILEMLASGVRFIVTTDCAGGLRKIPNVLVSEGRNADELAQLILKGSKELKGDEDVAQFLADRGPNEYFSVLS